MDDQALAQEMLDSSGEISAKDQALAQKMLDASGEILAKAERDPAVVASKAKAGALMERPLVVVYTPHGGKDAGKPFVRVVPRSDAAQVMKEAELESKRTGNVPVGFRLQSRNHPCYCGSGLKYKHCKCSRKKKPEVKDAIPEVQGS